MSIASNPNYLDVTGVDMPTLIKAAFDLSVPLGRGIFSFKSGPLSDQEAIQLSLRQRLPGAEFSMDYLHGRALKLTVFMEDDRLYIPRVWFDHSIDDMRNLMKAIGREDLVEKCIIS